MRTFGGLLGSRFELRSHTVLSDDGEHFRKGGASPAAETNESTVASVGEREPRDSRERAEREPRGSRGKL